MLKSGHAGIVPGDAGASAVIARVETHQIDERMPPEDRKPLTPSQVATLRAWVAAGADWPAHWPIVLWPSPSCLRCETLSGLGERSTDSSWPNWRPLAFSPPRRRAVPRSFAGLFGSSRPASHSQTGGGLRRRFFF
ncbi:c-type cytochrome domain-containing protein [Verrucomicrobium spinosum]|uniref:c-type cytochrome domain-containing protein n=1 Tax=Verrucomicrobium spinosum TaxID=2736 RepID=UPI001C48D284|nr:c-type cytochrome domain-containing protein [Verrucomicrobium spinosum]